MKRDTLFLGFHMYDNCILNAKQKTGKSQRIEKKQYFNVSLIKVSLNWLKNPKKVSSILKKDKINSCF